MPTRAAWEKAEQKELPCFQGWSLAKVRIARSRSSAELARLVVSAGKMCLVVAIVEVVMVSHDITD